MTALADAAMGQLREAFIAAADPDRAPAMAAYMRDQFPFLGLPTPVQRSVARAALRELPAPDEADVVALTTACWAMPEREYQYAGCDYAIRHALGCGPGFLGHARTLLITKSWWDTVDALAANVVGPLVRAHPDLVTVMDDWIDDDNDWLVRTAIIHQLHGKDATDAARLLATAPAGPLTASSSCARPSGGRCGSTRRPTPMPYSSSWRAIPSSHRCRRARR